MHQRNLHVDIHVNMYEGRHIYVDDNEHIYDIYVHIWPHSSHISCHTLRHRPTHICSHIRDTYDNIYDIHLPYIFIYDAYMCHIWLFRMGYIAFFQAAPPKPAVKPLVSPLIPGRAGGRTLTNFNLVRMPATPQLYLAVSKCGDWYIGRGWTDYNIWYRKERGAFSLSNTIVYASRVSGVNPRRPQKKTDTHQYSKTATKWDQNGHISPAILVCITPWTRNDLASRLVTKTLAICV